MLKNQFFSLATSFFLATSPLYVIAIPTIPEISLESLNVITWTPGEKVSTTNKSIDYLCNNIHNNKKVGITTTILLERKQDQPELIHAFAGVRHEFPHNQEGVIYIIPGGYAGFFGTSRYKALFGKNSVAGIQSTYYYLKTGTISETCVSFEPINHSFSHFNFGQSLDELYLTYIYESVVEKNPNAKIVLCGSCAATMMIIRFLSNYPHTKLKNVCAVMLESPSISLVRTSKHQMMQHTKLSFLAQAAPFLYSCVHPNWDPQEKTTLELLKTIPKKLPILIGGIPHDKTIPFQDTYTLAQEFYQSGFCNVHFFTATAPNIRHGQLARDKDFASIAQAFLQKYNLPHNAQLAQKGIPLLSKNFIAVTMPTDTLPLIPALKIEHTSS